MPPDPLHGPRSVLVLGGARSGKSAHAEALCRDSGRARLYVATAQGFDADMQARIARHRSDRAADGWRTLEEPLMVPETILREASADRVILIDCLTLWLTNLMLGGHDVGARQAALIEAVRAASGPLVLVSNEVGMGIVPETPLGRDFRDRQGRLNQAVAAACSDVILVAAGLPLTLKQS